MCLKRRRRVISVISVLLVGSVAAIAQAGSPNVGGGDRGESSAEARDLDGRHLYLVPATADGDAAIDEAGALVVADYPSFTLVSADGSAHERLRLASADRRDDMRTVATAVGAVDPKRAPQVRASSGEALALVQFVGPIKDEWLGQLRRTGVRVITYMAQNAYLVHSTADEAGALAEFAGDPSVRGIASFDAQDKTTPGLARGETVKAAVETLSGSDGSAARAQIEAAGRKLRGNSSVGETTVQFAEIGSDDLTALAANPDVVSVEPYVVPELLDERAAQIVAGNLNAAGTAPTGPGYSDFLNPGVPHVAHELHRRHHRRGHRQGRGAGARRLAPGLLRNGHPAQAEPARLRAGGHRRGRQRPRLRRSRYQRRLDRGRLQLQTGAAVEDAQGFNYGLGIAPRARLGATKIFNCAGDFDVTTSFTALTPTPMPSGARISNNSWGANVGGAYNADSQEFDALVRDAQPGVAGNQQIRRGVLGRQRRLRRQHHRLARQRPRT